MNVVESREEGALAAVYSTFASAEEAGRIGRALVERRLAACVNIFNDMVSIYAWEGNIEQDSETAMIIKTRAANVEAVIAEVSAMHSYDEPAFLVLPVAATSPGYGRWLLAQTDQAGT